MLFAENITGPLTDEQLKAIRREAILRDCAEKYVKSFEESKKTKQQGLTDELARLDLDPKPTYYKAPAGHVGDEVYGFKAIRMYRRQG